MQTPGELESLTGGRGTKHPYMENKPVHILNLSAAETQLSGLIR